MTYEQIFENYINDKCPICASEYIVGYNRRTNPISSEIIIENQPIYKNFTVSAEFEVNVLEQLGGKIPNGDREDFNNWLKYKALELGTGSHFEYYVDDLGIHEYGVAFVVKLKKRINDR